MHGKVFGTLPPLLSSLISLSYSSGDSSGDSSLFSESRFLSSSSWELSDSEPEDCFYRDKATALILIVAFKEAPLFVPILIL